MVWGHIQYGWIEVLTFVTSVHGVSGGIVMVRGGSCSGCLSLMARQRMFARQVKVESLNYSV